MVSLHLQVLMSILHILMESFPVQYNHLHRNEMVSFHLLHSLRESQDTIVYNAKEILRYKEEMYIYVHTAVSIINPCPRRWSRGFCNCSVCLPANFQ